MAPNDLVGWVAASFVLATFCAKGMATLRSLAIASNVAFVAYAYAADLWPILILHSVMLPINAMRLREALYGNAADTPSSSIPHPSLPRKRGRVREGAERLVLQAAKVSRAASKLYTRAVLPPAILACPRALRRGW